jgi:hypothetical protein
MPPKRKTIPPEVYITSAQARELLGVSNGTIKNMVDSGDLPGAHKKNPLHKNSPFRIPQSAVDRLLELRNKQGAKARKP